MDLAKHSASLSRMSFQPQSLRLRFGGESIVRKSYMLRGIIGLAALSLCSTLPAAAFMPAITITPVPYTLYGRQPLTLQGSVSRMCDNKAVQISQGDSSKWTPVGKATVNSQRRWQLVTRVPNSVNRVIYRADCGAQYSATMLRHIQKTVVLGTTGPGNRILGLDISRWQHIKGQTINFEHMANTGVSFVIIKASDGNWTEDAIARMYARSDVPRIKAAGLFVGYYHMVTVPTGNARSVLVASAHRQANLIYTRLKELGGYTIRTLPYTIDVEGINSSISQASLRLWTTTLVNDLVKSTHRPPMLYSYRSLLATRFARSPETIAFLRTMHLWLAQPGNPSDPKVWVGQYGASPNACFHTAWATSNCRTVWTFWQYTSLGNRDTYGIPWSPVRGKNCPSQAKYCVPGTGTGPLHLDMDVFNGQPAEFEALAAGTWQRRPTDYLEPTTSPSPSGTP